MRSVGINSYAVGEAPNVRLRGQGTDRDHNPNLSPRRWRRGVCAHSVGFQSHAFYSHTLSHASYRHALLFPTRRILT